MADSDAFEDAVPDHRQGRTPVQLSLFLNIDGFEGPIDLLLTLARDQKVDLTKISILQLAEQYVEFINAARRLNLELAADYLVMAAWLAYLKSRLLLPEEVDDDAPSTQEMAEILRLQLRRLEAMQAAGEKLMALGRLGVTRFPRGETQRLSIKRVP
ncbi:MAG: segregation and condensation protein A, partial [Thalassobaculaceae bacterium]